MFCVIIRKKQQLLPHTALFSTLFFLTETLSVQSVVETQFLIACHMKFMLKSYYCPVL